MAIEKRLPEYGNSEIDHNVEFTFHRSRLVKTIPFPDLNSISSTKIFNNAELQAPFVKLKTAKSLLKQNVIKNACLVADTETSFCNAYISMDRENIHIYELSNNPYAMFECKRVGVEEGMTKGPQTIEKAKQGAYVARTVSSIQRVWFRDGRIGGAIERDGKFDFYDDYYALIDKAILERDKELLKDFILTVGIVSNHGNWFTADHQNKELKVLSQSYDWLLFLTDKGLTAFIQDIMGSSAAFVAVKNAFESSYIEGKKVNRFTKTNMDNEADLILTRYFSENLAEIESWFNIIAPRERNIGELNAMLANLK